MFDRLGRAGIVDDGIGHCCDRSAKRRVADRLCRNEIKAIGEGAFRRRTAQHEQIRFMVDLAEIDILRHRGGLDAGFAAGPQFGLLRREAIGSLEGPGSHLDRIANGLESLDAFEIVDEFLALLRETVEDRPPRRLVFALMEEVEVEQQIGNVLAEPLPDRHKPFAQCRHLFILGFDICERPRVGHFTELRPRQAFRANVADEPVAKKLRRDAVGAVIVVNLVEQFAVLRLPPALVEDHARACGCDIGLALFHIEGFEIFDRIALLGCDQRARHHAEQIDKPPLSLELVNGRLADAVFCRQTTESCNFIVRIMIDVRLRVALQMRREELKQRGHRFALGGTVMRPEGTEAPFARIAQPDAVQIFEAALIKGITLDVVEEVAVVGFGQQPETLAGFIIPQGESRRSAGSARGLEPRLRLKPLLCLGGKLWNALGMHREPAEGCDACGLDLSALRSCHACYQGKAVGLVPFVAAMFFPAT